MVTVEDCARTNHIRPGLRPRRDCSAVGDVHNSGPDSECAQPIDRAEKPLQLFGRLAARGTVGEHFRSRKVRKSTGKFETLAFREPLREAIRFSRGDAETVHARVELEMN